MAHFNEGQHWACLKASNTRTTSVYSKGSVFARVQWFTLTCGDLMAFENMLSIHGIFSPIGERREMAEHTVMPKCVGGSCCASFGRVELESAGGRLRQLRFLVEFVFLVAASGVGDSPLQGRKQQVDVFRQALRVVRNTIRTPKWGTRDSQL